MGLLWFTSGFLWVFHHVFIGFLLVFFGFLEFAIVFLGFYRFLGL